jgi:hypothetical protein
VSHRSRRLNRYDLYELCAQAPERTVRFLLAAHGAGPRVLRDDFAGPAAIARAWGRLVPEGRAIAVDRDPAPLAHARRAPGGDRIRCLVADAARVRCRADVIAAFNFAVGELRDRPSLLRYLRAVRASLNRRGIFACDLYGGSDAYTPGAYVRRLRGPSGERIEYTWRQREADPTTAMVVNSMSFRVGPPARRDRRRGREDAAHRRAGPPRTAAVRVLENAFVYRWRLWTIAELRDALAEGGFASTEVYDRLGDAIDAHGRLILRPVSPGEGLDENWVVAIVARA